MKTPEKKVLLETINHLEIDLGFHLKHREQIQVALDNLNDSIQRNQTRLDNLRKFIEDAS